VTLPPEDKEKKTKCGEAIKQASAELSASVVPEPTTSQWRRMTKMLRLKFPSLRQRKYSEKSILKRLEKTLGIKPKW
jgi:hypothetical protein